MPAVINYGTAANRKNMSARRQRIGDGVTHASPDGAAYNFRRVDGTFVLNPPNCEIAGMIEDGFNREEVFRIKNTTGGSIAAGTLLANSTTLTAAGSATLPNIFAGSAVPVVIPSATGTIEAGSLCKLRDSVSPFDEQFSICTGVVSTTYTFDEIKYDMTAPTLTVIPAMIPTLATNASGGECGWVVYSAIANNAYGWVYGSALVTGIDTSAYSAVGSKVYLGTGGAATPTAPTSGTTTAQRVGKVVVKDAINGQINFYPHRRIIEKVSSLGLQSGAGVPTLTSAQIIVGDGSGVPTARTVTGNVTISNTGVTAIGATQVTNAMLAGSIDLTTKVTGILPSANGGTANGFTKFSGPTTAEKTFTLPDATATILTSNSAVTVAQGGTGLATLTSGALLTGNGTGNVALVGPGSTGQVLISTGSALAMNSLSGDATLTSAGVVTVKKATLAKTTGYTIVAADSNAVVKCDASGGAFQIDLTAAATLGNGFRVTILKTDSSSNAVTIDANSTETINGALTNVLHSQYSFVDLICDGSNWFVTNANDSISSVQTTYTNVPGSTGQFGDTVTIAVTPGVWSISAIIEYRLNSSTIAYVGAGIGTVTGNDPTGLVDGDNFSYGLAPVGTNANVAISIPAWTYATTSTVTQRLKAQVSYSAGNPQYVCRLSARRVG